MKQGKHEALADIYESIDELKYYREHFIRRDRAARAAMKFCSHCGSSALEFRVPEGDTLPRYVCGKCGTIHYQNPKVVVGCLPEWDGQVLLCKRAIEPRLGLWTLPAGFLENGETLVAGALRETPRRRARGVEVDELYTVISLPHINQVYVMFRARLLDLDFGPGPESLEVRAVRRGGHAVGAARVSHDHAHAAQLLPRSQARRHFPCTSARIERARSPDCRRAA